MTPDIPGILESFRTDRELAVTVANPTSEIEAQLARLEPESIEPVEMTLEDAFISYVGERGEKTFFMRDGERR
jgi:ABC-2 type transport system ATP-binding protein